MCYIEDLDYPNSTSLHLTVHPDQTHREGFAILGNLDSHIEPRRDQAGPCIAQKETKSL